MSLVIDFLTQPQSILTFRAEVTINRFTDQFRAHVDTKALYLARGRTKK